MMQKKTNQLIGFSCLVLVLALSILVYELSQYKMIDVHISGKLPEHNFTISMPRKDKQRLEFFFRHYCLLESWIYTLAGVKPVTFSSCPKKFPIWNFFLRRTMKLYKELIGWKTWIKYQNYFPNSRFITFTDKCLVYNDFMFIVILDRLQFNQIIKNHAVDFQSVLHLENLDSGKLLERTKTESFLQNILLDHDGLMGTVLGYGRDNAWNYHKRSQNNDIVLESIWDDNLHDQILMEWNKKPYFSYWEVSDLFYPTFMAIKNSEESIALREQYRKTREKIVKYYEGKDFVEATLSLFNCHIDDSVAL